MDFTMVSISQAPPYLSRGLEISWRSAIFK